VKQSYFVCDVQSILLFGGDAEYNRLITFARRPY